ncbi:MAG: hypothetical protein LHV69_08630 [Elusimicrobia bacterium]|nr:hypothetical protein [Candidatus Obscuribacterium magneticum]
MMRHVFMKILSGSALLLFPFAAWAVDPHAVLEALLPQEKIPRVLNSEDIPELRPNDPQPLFTPEGDFNRDGVSDIAIAGVYELPGPGPKFFLLVATERKDPVRYEKLYVQAYGRPVFLHRPGTTGEADPGDQAFSISFCRDCQEGQDFYWNKRKRQFDIRPWSPKVKRFQKAVEVPGRIVPPEVVDKAIQIVSQLKDVQKFTSDVKARGGALAVRVDYADKSEKTNRTVVTLSEKREGKEYLYDNVVVDIARGKVVKRKKK